MFASLPSYTAGQDVVQRYVTTPSEKAAARSLWLNIPMVFFGSLLFCFIDVRVYRFLYAVDEASFILGNLFSCGV